jgi:hypothetical protein
MRPVIPSSTLPTPHRGLPNNSLAAIGPIRSASEAQIPPTAASRSQGVAEGAPHSGIHLVFPGWLADLRRALFDFDSTPDRAIISV